jgi:hypothetical protein
MLILLITALALFAIIGIGLYFWQKSVPDTSEQFLPLPPNARGLFAEETSTAQTNQLSIAAAELAESLIARAQKGERSVLADAHQTNDLNLYHRVLDELAQRADSDPKLIALMSYIAQNDLPVNDSLAHAVLDSWKQSPDRSGTARALHFAALSNNAELFGTAVKSALGFWREEKLGDISAAELRALFDGEFWVLSSGARSSGAGFILKQTLASARRELEAAPRATR